MVLQEYQPLRASNDNMRLKSYGTHRDLFNVNLCYTLAVIIEIYAGDS